VRQNRSSLVRKAGDANNRERDASAKIQITSPDVHPLWPQAHENLLQYNDIPL
jgi:hypothetical protein